MFLFRFFLLPFLFIFGEIDFSAVVSSAEELPLPLTIEKEESEADETLGSSSKEPILDEEREIPLPGEKEMEEIDGVKRENEEALEEPEDLSKSFVPVIREVRHEEAVVVYVSKEQIENSFDQLSLNVMRQTLVKLSRNHEIYICPSSSEEMMWAARNWPHHRIMIQPKGAPLECVRQSVSALLGMGHKKVSVILSGSAFLSSEYIESSFSLLDHSDMVVGPLDKGGLCLLSASRDLPKSEAIEPSLLFENLLTLARKYKMTLGQLPPWHALKQTEELYAFTRSGNLGAQYLVERCLPKKVIAKVSIIIPLLNDENSVGRLLEELSCLEPLPERVFVDRGSQDGTVKLLRDAGERVICLEEKSSRAAALNCGVESAEGEYFLFLHPESSLLQNGYAQMMEELEKGSVEAGAFKYHFIKERRNAIITLVEKGGGLRCKLFKMPYGEQGYFVTKEAFSRVGPYKEAAIMEDIEWFQRMKRECSYTILEEALEISAKRIYEQGIIRNSIKNICLISLYKIGVKPDRLAKAYYQKRGQHYKR